MTTTAEAEPSTRIRILCCTSSLSGGGAERVLSTLASEWARAGHHVRLVTFLPPSAADYALDSRVERATLGIGTGSNNWIASAVRNLRRVAGLAREARTHRADVLLAFMESPNIAAILAGLLSDVPSVVSERVDPRTWTPGLPWRVLRRLLYPRASRVVVQTEGVATGWAHAFLDTTRVEVLPNPLTVPTREVPVPLRSRTATILAAGRLDRQKGFDVLIEAFALNRELSRNFVLEIAGDGPELASLQDLASRNGVSERVRFLGRVANLPDRMSRTRLFVLSSRFEGFPNVLLEALAAGTPVVATDCRSGPREILGVSGPFGLAPVEDAQLLARLMLAELQNSDENRVEIARAIAATYDAPAISARWEEVLRRAATSHSRSAARL